MIGFYLGRLLCWVGLHRWEWVHDPDWTMMVEVSYFRCRRRCDRYGRWMPGNLERVKARRWSA